MALNIQDAPYVHSNIYNFHSSIAEQCLNSADDAEGRRALEHQITEIEKFRDQLRTATDSFLMGKSAQEVSKELFDRENTYSQIGIRILRTPQMRDSLLAQSQYDVKSLQSYFEKNNLPEKIFNGIDFETMSMDAIIETIQSALPTNFYASNAKEQIGALKNIFDAKMGSVIEAKIKRSLRSTQGKIKQIIGELINQADIQKKQITSRNNSYQYFSQAFLKEVENFKVSYEGQTPEDYLREVKKNLESFNDLVNKGNASGVLGEQWMKAVTVSDSAKGVVIDIELTGSLAEGEGALKNMETMITHHKLGVQSQTDFVLVNQQGARARVQSKNYMEINNMLFNTNEAVLPNYRLQDERNYKSLMEALVNQGGRITDEDVNAISYLLVNELWFRTHGSYEKKGKTDRNITDNKGGLSGVVARIDQFITKALTNFLGITIDEYIDVKPDASNLFYSFNNRLLVPTYLILDEVVKKLREAEDGLASLHMSVKTSGLNWKETSAEKFYEAKANSVKEIGGLNPSKNYSDSALVGVGVQQGNTALGSITVSNVGLKIDIKTLLTSAYGF